MWLCSYGVVDVMELWSCGVMELLSLEVIALLRDGVTRV